MKKLMFTLVLMSAFSGQAQAELKWKKMQSGGGSDSVNHISRIITPNHDYYNGVKGTGYNNYGQLGDGTRVDKSKPVDVVEFKGAKQCSAGWAHTVCVMNDGSVKATGYNNYGQLGDGSIEYRTTPITITGFNGAKQCSAGSYYTVCVMLDGSVKATGRNDFGQLGVGDTTDRTSPVNIVGFDNARNCTAGENHTICVMSNGSVKVVGRNNYGQLGVGDVADRTSPVEMIDNSTMLPIIDAKQCYAGRYHTLCIRSDGSVKATGYNGYGELGDGTKVNKNMASTITNFEGAKQCTLNQSSTICVMSDGSVKAVGLNSYGHFGDGTKANKNVPIDILSLSGAKTCTTTRIGGNSTYPVHTVCVMEDGSVKVVGKNNYGQLGNQTTLDETTPITIDDFNNSEDCIASSYTTLCIIKSQIISSIFPPCDSKNDTFAKTEDGTVYICKLNKWKVLY